VLDFREPLGFTVIEAVWAEEEGELGDNEVRGNKNKNGLEEQKK
jgi:hypothetical protein